MAKALASLVTISNLGISGDIGPLSFYNTATGKLVCFPVTVPKEPPSPAQLAMRQRWRQAMRSWSLLPQQHKDQWRLAVNAAGLKITAINLWLWYQLYRDRDTLATIERQSGVTLPGI